MNDSAWKEYVPILIVFLFFLCWKQSARGGWDLMINDCKDEGLKMIVLSSFNKRLKTICDKSVFTTEIIKMMGKTKKAVLSSPCLHSGSTFYSIENDTVMVRLA